MSLYESKFTVSIAGQPQCKDRMLIELCKDDLIELRNEVDSALAQMEATVTTNTNTGKRGIMRKPRIKNKYKLTPASVKKLKVNREKLNKENGFWRNNVIEAWCISKTIGKFDDASFWLGIYDETAKAYAGKIRLYFTVMGGMCKYNINKFFDFSEIENEFDLQIQEECMKVLNRLLDEDILCFEQK